MKNKDINKSRPIVSYACHPLQKMFNFTGRSFMFLLLNNEELQHFTLPRTQDFISKYLIPFKDKYSTLDKPYEILSLSYDVKNMYTELPHDMIIQSLHWVLDSSSKTRFGRHKRVNLLKTGRNGVRFQRSGGTFSLSFNQLLEFASFDLNNVFFTLGSTILKQIIGIPMGSPLSPALAIIICAYAEHNFLSSIHDFKLLSACRYMDDLHVGVIITPITKKSYKKAFKILMQSQNIYPKTLTLEPTGSGSTDFLESSITYSKSAVQVRYFSKNKDFLTSSKDLKFYRFQPYYSFRPIAQIKGTLIGAFLRLTQHSDSQDSAFLSGLELISELILLSYPVRILKRVMIQMISRNPDPLWSKLLLFIKSIPSDLSISDINSYISTKRTSLTNR